MNPQEIIDAIKALSMVITANKGWLGSETVIREANEKIQYLIKKLP